MVFLQFSGKHAHVPVPGPVTRQSIWKWSTLITEMQIKRKEDLPQNVEQRSMLSSLASAGKQRAMASATKIKPRKKCIMMEFWRAQAKSPKSQVLRALSRWLPSTSNDGGTTPSLAFPYEPFLHCSGCSSFYLYLFNMDFHYTALNVHRSSLFLRNTTKPCIEIHLLIKDISPSPG